VGRRCVERRSERRTLHSNLDATEVAWSEELERRLVTLTEDSEAYWARRDELVWN
jgi:hypothetical protein